MSEFSIKRAAWYVLLGFVGLFIGRFAMGYVLYPDGKNRHQLENITLNTEEFVLERRNYASSKVVSKEAASVDAVMQGVDQKYEKIGSLASVTRAYDADEQALYALIKKEGLMVQLEQRAGLESKRQLNIALGVVPDKFDSIIAMLQQIGTLRNIQINKNDKTNEYQKLEAERVSLQKARDSLLELKTANGGVADMITLTNQLLELENRIQALGVNLGEFDVKNEFCTVKFTLREMRDATQSRISLMHRMVVALYWTANIYMYFWVIIGFGLMSLWLMSRLILQVRQMLKINV